MTIVNFQHQPADKITRLEEKDGINHQKLIQIEKNSFSKDVISNLESKFSQTFDHSGPKKIKKTINILGSVGKNKLLNAHFFLVQGYFGQ